MGSYVINNLVKGEEVVFEVHNHWITFFLSKVFYPFLYCH